MEGERGRMGGESRGMEGCGVGWVGSKCITYLHENGLTVTLYNRDKKKRLLESGGKANEWRSEKGRICE